MPRSRAIGTCRSSCWPVREMRPRRLNDVTVSGRALVVVAVEPTSCQRPVTG